VDDTVQQWKFALNPPRRGDVPVVSVIMPVYNGAQWLPAAVESVLAQTLANLELLIVDDKSQDDTLAIAQRFARLDARVRVLRHRVNRGQAAARNLALSQARGDWVAPVDADDQIRPDRLRRLVEAGEREGADLIADGILFEGERQPGVPAELMTWRRNDQRLEQLSAEALIRSGFGGGCRSLGYLKPLMRRRFLEHCQLRYAEDLRFAEDFNLYVRALFCGARFLLYPESHYVYWQTPESASRTEISRIAQDAVDNSRMLRAVVPDNDSEQVTAALDEYERRWQVLSWFEQMKRGLSERNLSAVIGLLIRMPVSARDIVQFALGRARMKRRGPQEMD
jgi:succinoglycan biosynthesis protein ExoO